MIRWFLSFKYGASERNMGGRRFTDLDEKRLEAIFSTLEHGLSVDHWISTSVKQNRLMRNG